MDDQLVPVTQVSEGAVLTQDDLDNFMLVSALRVSETRNDGHVIYEVPEELADYGLPVGFSGGGFQEFLHGLPRLPEPLGLPDLSGRMAPEDVPAPEPVRDQQQPAAAPKALSPMPIGPPGDDPLRPDIPPCEHLRTTRSGTNAHYNMLRCLDCGCMLQRERRTATTTATPKAAGHVGNVCNPGLVYCQHHSVTWAGTNAFRWRRTYRACGEVRTGPVAGSERLRTTSTSGHGLSASSTGHGLPAQAPGFSLQRPVRVSSFPMFIQVIQHALNAKRANMPQADFVSSAELHMLLDYAIGVTSIHELETGQTTLNLYGSAQPSMTSPATIPVPGTPASSSHQNLLRSPASQAEHLEDLGQQHVTFGKFKGQTYYQAW